jgi:branched-chain amino acid transport system permease protein
MATKTTTTKRSAVAVAIVLVVAWLLLATGGKQTLRFSLLGIGEGALIAGIALGAVLTFRGSGFINFGNGAIAMYAGYTFAGLTTKGVLPVPPLPNPLIIVAGVARLFGAHFDVPGIPTSVNFGEKLSFWPAFLITMVLSVLLGAVIHFLVSRPLRHAPLLAKVVASVGILLFLQAIIVLRYGTTPVSLPSFLPKRAQHLWGDITIPMDQIVITAIILAIALALWALFRYTTFGLSTTASANNEKGALVTGLNPGYFALCNWMLATGIAGLVGILGASISRTLDTTTIALLIVPALGAALVGRLTNFGVTALAGIAFGMSSSLIRYWGTLSWFPKSQGTAIPGVQDALPFLVIIVVLIVRGKSIPTRENVDERMPFAPAPTWVRGRALIVIAVALIGTVFLPPVWRLGFTNTIIGVGLCLSLVVLTGYVGQISLMHMAIAGSAGFALSNFTSRLHLPFPIGPILAVLVAAAVGILAAIPALRIRGANLAIVTLAASVAIESMVFPNPTWAGNISGAAVPPPRFLGFKFGPNDHGVFRFLGYHGDGKLPNPWFGLFALAVVAVVAVMTVCLRRSTTGRRYLAVRANERSAASTGVGLAGTKMLAFAMSAVIAGIAGVLSAYRFGSVTPEYFGTFASLSLLAFAYLGGITSVTGAVIGGFLVTGGVAATALDQWFGISPEYTILFGGFGLIATAVLHPGGLASFYRELGERLSRRWHRTREPAGITQVPAAAPGGVARATSTLEARQ